MTQHSQSRPRGAGGPARPVLVLVVDNTAPVAPASADPRPDADTVARFGLPPEFNRLVATHGAPVYRAMGVRPPLHSVATGRSDSWWWDWAE